MSDHTNKSLKSRHFSLSARHMNLFMAFITLVISVLLLFATYRANGEYGHMREHTDQYIQWQKEAHGLQDGSDYLTEAVRCFTETGKREYLDDYFTEALVTRRRDQAVETMRELLGDSHAVKALEEALSESVALMEREYYAMRLTVEAYGDNLAEYPEAIQAVALSEEDAALPAEGKEALARAMVFDDIYHGKKQNILDNMNKCLDRLEEDLESQQVATADKLQDLLLKQRVLIIIAIAVILVMMLMTLLLVISPLVRAVMYIRAEKPLPIKGSKEFQFLAKTYNLMYENNREQKEQLAYEATHDSLTGVYNRNGFDFIRQNMNWDTSALVLFDVDVFKSVNDTFGHEMGDKLLVRVAEAIRSQFRSQDFVCRIGGDEFAVIMVQTTPDASRLIVQKVERINEKLNTEKDGIPAVHLSCGAAYGHKIPDYEELFHEADAAMYRVKSVGGNGCEVCI